MLEIFKIKKIKKSSKDVVGRKYVVTGNVVKKMVKMSQKDSYKFSLGKQV
jgi:hypothetical protein